jgi:broad specificity phosphatase PhoE
MDNHFQKYLKYKSKYLELSRTKKYLKGTKTGEDRARAFAEKFDSGSWWGLMVFSHGKFIREVVANLLGNNYSILNRQNTMSTKNSITLLSESKVYTVDIFFGVEKSELAKCAGLTDEQAQKVKDKFDKKSLKKGDLYKFIGNGALLRISKGDDKMYFVRHFPSTANLADVTKKGSKFVRDPPVVGGNCMKKFLEEYKKGLGLYLTNNTVFAEEIESILKRKVVYISCLQRTRQTAQYIVREYFGIADAQACVMKGIHEIGRFDIANKCPSKSTFDCNPLMVDGVDAYWWLAGEPVTNDAF